MHHRLLISLRKVIVPGKPDESELIHVLTLPNTRRHMPPDPYEPLSAEDIAVLRQWVLEGAPPFPKYEPGEGR